jgi:hypothetical protein
MIETDFRSWKTLMIYWAGENILEHFINSNPSKLGCFVWAEGIERKWTQSHVFLTFDFE